MMASGQNVTKESTNLGKRKICVKLVPHNLREERKDYWMPVKFCEHSDDDPISPIRIEIDRSLI
jgi:hypothetical protein